MQFTCWARDHSIDPKENTRCSLLRVVPSTGYLSIPLNISAEEGDGSFENVQAQMINLNSAHIFIILSLLSLPTHGQCRGRGETMRKLKDGAIVWCPSTGQSNTEWQEMKECQKAATVLLFAPNGFPLGVHIKMLRRKRP